MKDDVSRLQFHAQEFADELTATVQAVSPQCLPFIATSVDKRVVVEQSPNVGIPLMVSENVLITLKVRFQCRWSDAGEFLTVDSSSISAFAGTSDRQPIFRYEYERGARTVPAAHLHVHAHRDAFTYTMAKAGMSTARGERRANSDQVPSLQEIHFPLGGHRFRPSLEDVLEMLIDEFGVDHDESAREKLAQGRARWRLVQTRAAVRDAPATAADTLRDLGYHVELPEGVAAPANRRDRLTSP